MPIHISDSTRQFLATAAPLLQADPFSTNVIGVVAARICAGQEPASDTHLWASIEDDRGELVGVAMHTPPQHVFVSRMPSAAATSLAGFLADHGRDLSGVSGALVSTRPVAEEWTVRTGRASRLVTAMRLYRLDELVWPRGVHGAAGTAATSSDVDVVAGWLEAFHAEVQPHTPVMDWRALAEQRVGAGQVHVWWDDNVPVAFAAVSAPALGVARVGPVYTLPRYRRRGYGAAVTAAASAAALSGGSEHVVLYTDRANPTSNSIYQAIGYRPEHDAEERAFD